MLNEKGFTLAELLVAGITAVVLLAIIASFLMYSSRASSSMIRGGTARENLYIALELMRQDIMHAGAGLYDSTDWATTKKLVLDMTDPETATNPTGYTKLYLSYGRYLSSWYPPDDQKNNPNYIDSTDPTKRNPNYFLHKAYKKAGDAASGGDPVYLDTSGYYNNRIGPYDIGYLIGQDGSVLKLSPAIDTYDGSYQGKFNFVGATPAAGSFYAPAVSYECDGCGTADTDRGSLIRNVPFSGTTEVKIFGGEPGFRVTAFRVRAQYRGEAAWRDGGGLLFDPASMENLRVVEVRIRYQVKDPGGMWTPEQDAVLRACPRVLFLQQ